MRKKNGRRVNVVWKQGEGNAYELLAQLLVEQKGVEPPAMARQANGKPWFPAQPDLHFNVSHSGGLALCAIADTEVGVDIEIVRNRTKGLPRYALNDTEYAWFAERGSRWEDFYTLWTLKESRAKCTGRGIFQTSVRDISVPRLEVGETALWEGLSFTALGGEEWRGGICLTIL